MVYLFIHKIFLSYHSMNLTQKQYFSVKIRRVQVADLLDKKVYINSKGKKRRRTEKGEKLDGIINLNVYPVSKTLKQLLRDKTTRQNILFLSSAYRTKDGTINKTEQMTEALLRELKDEIQPRTQKSREHRQKRTKGVAEVSTPAWLCNRMNNDCDERWFEGVGRFNWESGQKWETSDKTVDFAGKNWKKYVDSRRLEITCGEAPYMVSRYDAATGQRIELSERIGMLDRKLRVINENTKTQEEWLKWVIRAYQSVYGYELLGDNLLIARINLLITFAEYMQERWKRVPTDKELKKIANIIVWNFWQMDGITGKVPFLECDCRIYDWRSKKSFSYCSVKEQKKKFDFIVGNPPYQEKIENNGRPKTIYHKFMEEAYQSADYAELITPARFLFQTGHTPKEWNKKMLCDPHFKVLHYEEDAAKVFDATHIKGGVVITARDVLKDYEPIKVVTFHPKLNGIVKKVLEAENAEKYMNYIISSRGCYKTTECFSRDFPYAGKRLGMGTGNMISSNFFEKIPEAYRDNVSDEKEEYVGILSRVQNSRKICYMKREYVKENEFMRKYNVALPKANGMGVFGEILAAMEIISPREGTTDTFISVGKLETLFEAQALEKYIKTKFLRALLGARKVTQDNSKGVWNLIPVQDFTRGSDIDWNTSVAEIDRQLYKKYCLSEEEVEFIETKVKTMT